MANSNQVRAKVRIDSDLNIVVPATLTEALGLRKATSYLHG